MHRWTVDSQRSSNTENISIWWRHHGDMACGNMDGNSDVHFSYYSVGMTPLIKEYPFWVLMRSWRGNTFSINGHLRGESTGHLWITLQSGDNKELWWFLWRKFEQFVEQAALLSVIWDAMTDMLRHFNVEPHKDHTLRISNYPFWNKKWNEIFTWHWCNVYYQETVSWWHHRMETFSALLAICAGNSPVPAEFPTQRPVMLSFDVFFDLRLNKRLSKQSWGWWFETLSRPLWRQYNAVSASIPIFHAVIMGMSENYMYNFHHIRVDRLRVNRLNIVLDEY